jgi:heptosyltransferase-3
MTSVAIANDPNIPRIALVAFSSLGDSLIYLMMAENLQRNGYHVTVVGTIAYQLRQWLPQLEIRPYPAIDRYDEALVGFDLVIMSPPHALRDRMDAATLATMQRKWLLICQKAPTSWRFDLTEMLRKRCAPDIFSRLQNLADCGGPIRHRHYAGESIVDITLTYMRERMGLNSVARTVPLSPPAGLRHRHHIKRVIVSPDSAWPEKKDWSPRSFLKLCRTLRKKGFAPTIVVAPANHSRWQHMPGNNFDTPVFHDIAELAAYIYESGATIANDSGNGHLASFLGIPVVTIYRKRDPMFQWRPDWGPCTVVCPRLTLPWVRGHIWKPFLATKDIVAALERVI